jgi:hypothetical protein
VFYLLVQFSWPLLFPPFRRPLSHLVTHPVTSSDTFVAFVFENFDTFEFFWHFWDFWKFWHEVCAGKTRVCYSTVTCEGCRLSNGMLKILKCFDIFENFEKFDMKFALGKPGSVIVPSLVRTVDCRMRIVVILWIFEILKDFERF